MTTIRIRILLRRRRRTRAAPAFDRI